jgi:hypothetical protein
MNHQKRTMNHLWITGCLWILAAACSIGQDIRFTDVQPTYDGNPAHPRIWVDGIAREAAFSYREIDPEKATTVFSNLIPDILPLSYRSQAFQATKTSALGNLVQLEGSQRVADCVEVVMVTWARAANYSALAALDPSGYQHPVSASIYELKTDAAGATSLQLLDEATTQVQIPWRPERLPNGSNYPYSGYAFKALIPFDASITVPDACIIVIAFNTQNVGATPLGVPGPYNELNLAVSRSAPVVGNDPDTDVVFWIKNGEWRYPASNWGSVGAPILRLSARALPQPSPALDPTFMPVNAGIYQARAEIMPEDLAVDTVFTISKAPVDFQTAGLTKSIADSDPFITVLNSSPGLVTEITYNGSNAVPVRPDRYPFAIAATDRNHSGALTGEFHLTGKTYAQWYQNEFPGGDPAGQSTWLAYATGGEPPINGQPLGIEATAGGMSVRFLQRREMSGGRIALEFSSDLSRWDEVPTQALATDDCWDTHSSTSAASDGFFRLKAVTESTPP